MYNENIHTQQKCKFCNRTPDRNKGVCEWCISEKRPKISLFWIIFWFICSAGIISLIYYLWKRNKQEEWDRKHL